ncbi:unnamed protein product [Pleuronectes platessa]|uniref:Uncharacterized protein n=1 Tax=Pleuronectes platessa TaxID=8262 RepID=A0A9N7Y599_PLEPL|nr:unnamed protein product [Pleuronectes platessa]
MSALSSERSCQEHPPPEDNGQQPSEAAVTKGDSRWSTGRQRHQMGKTWKMLENKIYPHVQTSSSSSSSSSSSFIDQCRQTMTAMPLAAKPTTIITPLTESRAASLSVRATINRDSGLLSQLLGASLRVPPAVAVAEVIREKGPTRVRVAAADRRTPVPSNGPPSAPAMDTAPRSKRKKAPPPVTL